MSPFKSEDHYNKLNLILQKKYREEQLDNNLQALTLRNVVESKYHKISWHELSLDPYFSLFTSSNHIIVQ